MDGPVNTGAPDNFPGNNASFKYKRKITVSTGDECTKAVQIIVPLKYLSNVRELLKCH